MSARPVAKFPPLSQFIRKRNGVPAGAAGSMRNMLHRSLGAGSFAGFWRHWNPIFGYGLLRFVYAPSRRLLPAWLAVLVTFVACGALHDLVTMAVRRAPAFLFTPWFLLMGAGVVAGQAARMDLSRLPWAGRAAVNLGCIGASLGAALALRRAFGLP